MQHIRISAAIIITLIDVCIAPPSTNKRTITGISAGNVNASNDTLSIDNVVIAADTTPPSAKVKKA